jgi:GTPase SAR1 family protein
MFDLTNLETLENIPKWMEEVKSFAPNSAIILIGTKLDLVETSD